MHRNLFKLLSLYRHNIIVGIVWGLMKLKRVSGWLTRKDIEMLDEASIKPIKVRNPAQKYKCASCDYMWLYSSARCPICSSTSLVKV